MKAAKFILLIIVLFSASCGTKDNKASKTTAEIKEPVQVYIPLDKGFSEYIASYTSGIIPVNGDIEIRFTPEFASKADKSKLSGLFEFEPSIKGKAEWTDDITLVFKPSRMLEPGNIYTGGINLFKFGITKERLRVFPLRIQTLKKDFQISVSGLECNSPEATAYDLHGELVTSDFITPSEVESYLSAKLNKRSIKISWDHSSTDNIHQFTAENIERTDKLQELTLNWDLHPLTFLPAMNSVYRIFLSYPEKVRE
jgi:hypothetical protein